MLWQIQDSGYADKLRNGIVLTGGGANLVNIANLIKEMSGYTVRIGFPRSQAFSSEGCAGVGETSSVATIGMILEAKKDIRLNCIEDAQAAAPAPVVESPEGKPAEPAPTTLFEDTEEIIVPRKKEKEPSKFIRWMKQQGKKMSSAAEDAFDNTVGGLFDNMQ